MACRRRRLRERKQQNGSTAETVLIPAVTSRKMKQVHSQTQAAVKQQTNSRMPGQSNTRQIQRVGGGSTAVQSVPDGGG